MAAGRNEPVVPSAVVQLGRLGSGGSAWQWCRPADSAGRDHRAVPTHPPKLPYVRHPYLYTYIPICLCIPIYIDFPTMGTPEKEGVM